MSTTQSNFILSHEPSSSRNCVSSPDADPRIHAAIEHAIAQAAWDEAFALIEAFHVRDVLDRLMTASFTPLLAEGRVETLERFMRNSVSQRRGTSPLIDLIDAEISFRDGLLDQAQALAVSAADELPDSHPLKAHGYVLGGTSALARFRISESYALHLRALEFTQTPQDERNALWGQCLALIYLEDDASIEAAHRLSRIGGALPEDRLRAATGTPTRKPTDGRVFGTSAPHSPRETSSSKYRILVYGRHRECLQLRLGSAGKVRRGR